MQPPLRARYRGSSWLCHFFPRSSVAHTVQSSNTSWEMLYYIEGPKLGWSRGLRLLVLSQELKTPFTARPNDTLYDESFQVEAKIWMHAQRKYQHSTEITSSRDKIKEKKQRCLQKKRLASYRSSDLLSPTSDGKCYQRWVLRLLVSGSLANTIVYQIISIQMRKKSRSFTAAEINCSSAFDINSRSFTVQRDKPSTISMRRPNEPWIERSKRESGNS